MPDVYLSIDGVQYATDRLDTTKKALYDTLVITDILDDTPTRAQCTVQGFIPTVGQELVVALGSDRIFAGPILSVEQVYVGGIASHYQCHISAVDYTWLLNRRKVTKRYTSQSATAIAQDLISTYASGFTSANVAASLATVDEITFTEQDLTDALTQLAKRIGGYWYCDYYKDLHFFLSETGSNPATLTLTHATLTSFQVMRDLSQIVTRVRVEGGGSNALSAVDVSDTVIPVEDSSWYDAAGGTVKSGPQRIAYTGVDDGGGGALVGVFAVPTNAPTLALANDVTGALGTGDYKYAVTFYDGTGETTPGPTSSTVAVGTLVAAPTNTASGTEDNSGGNLTPGGYHYYTTFTDVSLETAPSAIGTAGIISDPSTDKMNVTGIPVSTTTGVGASGVRLYRGTVNSTTVKKHVVTLNNGTTTYQDNVSDGDLGASAPTTGNLRKNAVNLTSIQLGPSGTTGRKLYRVAVNGSQLKLLATIADNTTTTYLDKIADGSLGANVPTSNTSAITAAGGLVTTGATTLEVTAVGAFRSAGGWARAGGQHIRYTGISSTALTGVPASGTGAILSTLNYGSEIVADPVLTGVSGLLYAIAAGDEVNLLVTRNDTAAQTTLAALLAVVLGASSDGIQEEYIQDRRLSQTEAEARGDALLALRSAIEVSIRYRTRDRLTRSGRTQAVNIGSPFSVVADFKIQQVVISHFRPQPDSDDVYPDFDASASSTRFTLEDLLRLARQGLAIGAAA